MSEQEDDATPDPVPDGHRKIAFTAAIVPGDAAVIIADGVAEEDHDLLRRIQHSLVHALDRPRDAFIVQVRDRVRANDHEGAALLLTAHGDAEIAVWARNGALLDALLSVDADQLSESTRRRFVRSRAAIACDLREFLKAEPDVERLLEAGGFSDVEHVMWQSARADAAAQKQHRELALHRFQALAASLTEAIPPRVRAYVVGRVAALLPERDPDAAVFAEQARDLYLMAGDRPAAVTHQVERAIAVQRRDPRLALVLLDEARAWVVGDDVFARVSRARIHHLAAAFLAERHEYAKARDAAAVAVAECRGLVGHEDKLVANLEILAETERELGNEARAESLSAEARALVERLGDPQLLARDTLARSIRRSGRRPPATVPEFPVTDPEHEFWRHVVLATNAEDLETTLMHAEAARQFIATCTALRDDGYLPCWIMGAALARHGKPGRAIVLLKEALKLSPWTLEARDLLIHLLWKDERWSEAVVILREQIGIFGELPGLMFALGRSLLEAGDAQRAAKVLSKCIRMGGADVEEARALVLRAVEAGAAIDVPSTAMPAAPTVDELRRVLARFATNIASNQRMSFWRTDAATRARRWRENPEEHGKQLLLAALAMALGETAEVLEEVKAGAGRIDLYVRLGALRVVIELKMCGGRSYTTAYALEGLDQLTHYMDAKRTKLGFLVVFDARRAFGSDLPAVVAPDAHTIYVIAVDVRPGVKSDAEPAG